MKLEPALILMKGCAKKTGPRSSGGIHFHVLCDGTRTELMIAMTQNEGGSGYFSPEAVPFSRITDCLKSLKADEPFSAKVFKGAYTSRSSCNPGFCGAILRELGLLTAPEEAPSQHLKAGDWKAWQEAMLKRKGETYVPPAPKEGAAAKVTVTSTETPRAERAQGKRKGKEPEAKQLPDSEAGHADRQA